MAPIGILILAAGGSARLGRPKQLLPWGSTTLIEHATRVALEAALGPVAVVLGGSEEACRTALHGLPVQISSNPGWAAGMGSSITAGIRTLGQRELAAVIIHLCDQPLVTSGMLQALSAEQRRTGAEIVVSSYLDTLGPPALFTAAQFSRLRELSPSAGAKSLFLHEASLATVSCPAASRDLDTEEDYESLCALWPDAED